MFWEFYLPALYLLIYSIIRLQGICDMKDQAYFNYCLLMSPNKLVYTFDELDIELQYTLFHEIMWTIKPNYLLGLIVFWQCIHCLTVLALCLLLLLQIIIWTMFLLKKVLRIIIVMMIV